MENNIDNENKDKELVEKEVETKKKEQCFVIMPIGDHPSHEKGHFIKIYRDLIKPAIEDADFEAYRADEGGGSQNIQIDIIKKIIEAPMAVCDLSTRNPNVLFELGIRQAFDLPVALIQEIGTERIFDIQTFNTGEYRSARIYDEVVQDRKNITNLIKNTYRKHSEGDGVNSIIRLIPTIDKAKLSEKGVDSEELIRIMFNQINNLSRDISNVSRRLEINGLNEVTFEQDESISKYSVKLLKLINELPYLEKTIFRLANEEELYLTDIKERLGLDYSEISRIYNKVKNYLQRNGIDLEKYNILDEIMPF